MQQQSPSFDNSSPGQVQLSRLIFANNWEDPAIDERVLHIKEGDTVFTITSGGCNSLGFLRFSPAAIYCVDINPAQNYLMELKQAAIRELDYERFSDFVGLNDCSVRKELFNDIKKHLSREALMFWNQHLHVIRKGVLMNGKYERFVKIAGRLLRLMQGQKKANRFFNLEGITQQKKFYSENWDNQKWRWVFKVMFNKKRLAKKGLVVDYFHFDDGSASFSESFYRRASHVMCDIPARTNYFLALYFLGHYLNKEEVPEYLKPENYGVIKRNIERIHPVTADSKYWLENQTAGKFDGFALSNICELMNAEDTWKLFNQVLRTSKRGGKIVFRNLMLPREVPEELRNEIVKDEALSQQIQFEDRSFVYGKVAAYDVKK